MLKSLKLKKWTSLIVALVMTVTLFSPFAGVAKAAEGDKVFDIIEITDFHGSLESPDLKPQPIGAVLAKHVKDIKAQNPDRTLILGGGDLYQGAPISNVLKGVPVQEFFTDLGMDVTTLGNHEFDWGLDTIINTTMKGAGYEIVAANLYNKNDNSRVFKDYKKIEKDGIKIAVIGAITTETESIVMPKFFENYRITDPATEINAAAARIKASGEADVVIALIHEGTSTTDGTGPIFSIAEKLTGVDAVFGGHSHTKIARRASNGIPVYIANSSGKGYVHIRMTVGADKSVSFPNPSSTDYIAIDGSNDPNGYKAASPIIDPAAAAIVKKAVDQVGPTFSEVIGKTDVKLTRTTRDNPYVECYLGNWAADVIRRNGAIDKDGKITSADVGLSNNGGLRIDIDAGDITVKHIYYFMPFDNEINYVKMTGEQLDTVLEQALKDATLADLSDKGKGIQVSGIKFYFDTRLATGNRVYKIVRENGAPILPTDVLTVAGPDFLLTGGDGFTKFKDTQISSTLVNTRIIVRDALLADTRANKGIVANMNNRLMNAAPPIETISVVATSDIHGNVLDYDYATGKIPVDSKGNPVHMGLAKVSTYVNGLRAGNGGRVMLVDNGDTIQGTPLVYYYNMIDTKTPHPMSAVMAKMGYDTWTLGNHEFNYGLGLLNNIIRDAKTGGVHVLGANIYNTSGTNYVEPYYIKEFNVGNTTKKVAVIGLTTKNVPGWEDPAHYEGLKFNDLVLEAEKWVKEVKDKGADVVIVTAHSGEEGDSDTTEENQIKAIATKVSGIDAIVAGHVHNIVNRIYKNPDGKNVLVTEPGKWTQNVSQIDINFDATGKLVDITTREVKMNENIAEDPEIVELIQPYHAKTLEYIKTKLGASTGEFTGKDQTIKPTAIMDLINEVQRTAAGTQLSIAAPLSASARIPQGDVTIQDIMSVYIYENFLYGIKMTGKQVKDWMEFSVSPYKQVANAGDGIAKSNPGFPDYNLDQLYGASYEVDLTQPAGTIDKATGKLIGGNRIKNLKFNGKLVKDTDVFTVAINNYRFNGGGGFMKAAGLVPGDMSIVVYDSAKSLGDDGQVRSLMMEYIKAKGTISPVVVSTWKISTTPVTQELPKTGSVVDFSALGAIGGASTMLGAAFIVMQNRRKKKSA